MPSSPHPIVINPDHFLQTERGRVWTPERSRIAWQQSYDALRTVISTPSDDLRSWTVIIVCGLQGAGKSTWISKQPVRSGVVYFDAALPAARHRAPIIEIARSANAQVEIVWIKVPLSVALARNAQRNDDEQVSQASIQSVAELFENPTTAEGAAKVYVIETSLTP